MLYRTIHIYYFTSECCKTVNVFSILLSDSWLCLKCLIITSFKMERARLAHARFILFKTWCNVENVCLIHRFMMQTEKPAQIQVEAWLARLRTAEMRGGGRGLLLYSIRVQSVQGMRKSHWRSQSWLCFIKHHTHTNNTPHGVKESFWEFP